ncbi:hypothetical protein [uncultured Campylobacter sp.]|uniref:hypothetical protein n=1 Tax=uncultured Campylobacter sp. TaxID=218934 RepID=UPI0028E526CD|nr:hypothetical protein [uncultured Campylobacter sp.]
MDFCLALILYARYSYFKCAPIEIFAFDAVKFSRVFKTETFGKFKFYLRVFVVCIKTQSAALNLTLDVLHFGGF